MSPASEPQRQDQLVEIWVGFLIKHQGKWTDEDERGLRAWASFREAVSDSQWAAARDQALRFWDCPDRRLVLCTGAVCSPKRPRPTAQQLQILEQLHGCPVVTSDCQNFCARAPAATELNSAVHPPRLIQRLFPGPTKG